MLYIRCGIQSIVDGLKNAMHFSNSYLNSIAACQKSAGKLAIRMEISDFG